MAAYFAPARSKTAIPSAQDMAHNLAYADEAARPAPSGQRTREADTYKVVRRAICPLYIMCFCIVVGVLFTGAVFVTCASTMDDLDDKIRSLSDTFVAARTNGSKGYVLEH